MKKKKLKRQYIKSRNPLMYDICMEWFEEIKLYRKKSTIVKYKSQLDNHIIPFLGKYKINSISNADIMILVNTLLESGLSTKTVSDIHSRIIAIHKFATLHDYSVKFTPNCVRIPQCKKSIRTLSMAEEKRILSYINEHPDLTSLGILLCLFTGIRIGELCALMWNDISLSSQEISIKRTMQRLKRLDNDTNKRTYICIDEPKSISSIRIIPIPDNIMERLKKAYTSNAYVLTGHPYRFVEPRTMENRFKTILKKCDIKNANYHTLRHSYATRCIEAGMDIKVLSEILGHSNVNITLNRYVHPSKEFKHENVKKLSNLFPS